MQEFTIDVHDKARSGVLGESIEKPTVHTFTDPERNEGRALDLKKALLGGQPKFFL